MFYTNVSNGQHSNNMLVRKDMDVSEHERLSTPPSPPSLSSDDIQSKIVTSTERSKVMMVEVENVNHIPFTSSVSDVLTPFFLLRLFFRLALSLICSPT
jgi:hypothetical protein